MAVQMDMNQFLEAMAHITSQFNQIGSKLDQVGSELDQVTELAKINEERFKESSQKSAREFQEMRQAMKESAQATEKRINALSGLFSSQWGRMVEAIVHPDLVRLFRERGIKIIGSAQRVEKQINGETMEIDVLLHNGDEIVLVEVKSTFKNDDVDDFLEDLRTFLKFFPEYRKHRIYGAIAGLEIPKEVSRRAYKKGLFVIGISGENLTTIENDHKFKPKDFSQKG